MGKHGNQLESYLYPAFFGSSDLDEKHRGEALRSLATNVAHIRDLFEESDMRSTPQQAGEREYNLEARLDSRDLEDAMEGLNAQARRSREETSSRLDAVRDLLDRSDAHLAVVAEHSHELPEIRFGIEDLTDTMRAHLGATAVGLGSVFAQIRQSGDRLVRSAQGNTAEIIQSIQEAEERSEEAVEEQTDRIEEALAEQTDRTEEALAQQSDRDEERTVWATYAVCDTLGAIHGTMIEIADRHMHAHELSAQNITTALHTLALLGEAQRGELARIEQAVRDGATNSLALQAEECFRDARLNLSLRNFTMALRDLRRAIGFKSTHVGAWLEIGRLCESLGQNTRAKLAYRRAIDLAVATQEHTHLNAALVLFLHLEESVGDLPRGLRIARMVITKVDAGNIPEAAFTYYQLASSPKRAVLGYPDRMNLCAIFHAHPEIFKTFLELTAFEPYRTHFQELLKYGSYAHAHEVAHLVRLSIDARLKHTHEEKYTVDVARLVETLAHSFGVMIENVLFQDVHDFPRIQREIPSLWNFGQHLENLYQTLLHVNKDLYDTLSNFLITEENGVRRIHKDVNSLFQGPLQESIKNLLDID